MQCKQCGARLEPEMELCPECGMKIEKEEQIVQETEALETESVSSACEEEIAEKTPAKTGRILKMVLAVAAVAVLLCMMVLVVFQDKLIPGHLVSSMEGTVPGNGNASDVTCKGSYTASIWGLKLKNNTVVAKMGDNTLTNGQLQIFYNMAQYDVVQSYTDLSAINLDMDKPMDRQVCGLDASLSWQQYFLKKALEQWQTYMYFCDAAEAAGFTLPESQKSALNALYNQYYENYVKTGQYASVEAIFQETVSPGCTYEDYMTYKTWDTLAGLFYNQRMTEHEVTEADIESYYQEFKEMFEENDIKKNDGNYVVDVRHILITIEEASNKEEQFTDKDWELCKEQAQELLDQWLAGEATRESFAELANKYSGDPGSNKNGGLYTGVQKGDMVSSFDAWCFAEDRKVGDYGLVKSDYGYHIMYFDGSEEYWHYCCRIRVPYWKEAQRIEDDLADMEMDVNYAKIGLWETAYGN